MALEKVMTSFNNVSREELIQTNNNYLIINIPCKTYFPQTTNQFQSNFYLFFPAYPLLFTAINDYPAGMGTEIKNTL